MVTLQGTVPDSSLGTSASDGKGSPGGSWYPGVHDGWMDG